MLSYQHGYHAGNFADVIKHITLTRLLAYMLQKDKPLFYLETHSGRGIYDLQSKQAKKTAEYKQGIELLWSNKNRLPAVFTEYLQGIEQVNSTSQLHYYPGSPYLVIQALRPQDRAFFCELHPTEFDFLQKLPRYNKRVHYSHSDGVDSLKALLPPPEKRGLIFIDPSFEIKEEYKILPRMIKQAHERFHNGVYCLWYPMVNRLLTEKLLRGMQLIENKKYLHIEFSQAIAPGQGMTGCGLWIINPPFTLGEEMKMVVDVLKPLFKEG